MHTRKQIYKEYKHKLDASESNEYTGAAYRDPRMLNAMFLPRTIPENLEDDDLLREILKIKGTEVEDLAKKMNTACNLPMVKIKEYLKKVI